MPAAPPRTDPVPGGPLRPIVVVSECLGFEAVRYNGQILRSRFVEALREHVDFVQVCPEVGIGLGVPRDPVRLVRIGEEDRLVQPSTGADLTEPMRDFARDFLTGVGPVDGFILKSRSPTCGIKDVKVYPAEAGKPPGDTTAGLFAAAVAQRFPLAAVEDDGRLSNARIRHHFLTRLYAAARLRRVRGAGRMAELVRFQTEYKLQLMAYGQAGLRELGRTVANAEGLPFETVVDGYADALARLLASPPRVGNTINVLQHAFGYFSRDLSAAERAYFLELLEEYRAERLPLSAVLTVLRAWILRFQQGYLAAQRFLAPYPRALAELADSGSGRA